ncbi:MAG: murein transglycosylase [Flavobacterium sp. MedPE-SWcel]|uniref:lytic transglycosylase domain-containing protein n=1 Tax=uncultured Flavobacterium sp. TaxID=165435 RepID=UPI000920199E|nr:lytic transglycosylase domain-containing protein [uncultured Flavobacterium sp.]OIQ22231.1 MAG: murein transglycosylase [Flavobacterium sp. MedPE-SWcel]
MEWIRKTGIIASVVLVSGVLIHAVSNNEPREVKQEVTPIGCYFPDSIDFAGENTPLNLADVKERFDRELLVNANLHATTQIIIKRANRAFAVIEPILEKNGVPDDFKYLAVAESGLVNAVSPAGARGVWQFMPKTGKQFGLEVNKLVDERYHLEKSTEAACQYLLKAKEKFGSWTLAAASYNAGLAGVNRQLEFQGVDNYYDLLLNSETSRYVFRILALKQVMENPYKYHFQLLPDDMYPVLPTKKVVVDTSITDLAVFAKEQGVNYKILKIHNPWLRSRKLNNPLGKEYTMDIPVSGY